MDPSNNVSIQVPSTASPNGATQGGPWPVPTEVSGKAEAGRGSQRSNLEGQRSNLEGQRSNLEGPEKQQSRTVAGMGTNTGITRVSRGQGQGPRNGQRPSHGRSGTRQGQGPSQGPGQGQGQGQGQRQAVSHHQNHGMIKQQGYSRDQCQVPQVHTQMMPQNNEARRHPRKYPNKGSGQGQGQGPRHVNHSVVPSGLSPGQQIEPVPYSHNPNSARSYSAGRRDRLPSYSSNNGGRQQQLVSDSPLRNDTGEQQNRNKNKQQNNYQKKTHKESVPIVLNDSIHAANIDPICFTSDPSGCFLNGPASLVSYPDLQNTEDSWVNRIKRSNLPSIPTGTKTAEPSFSTSSRLNSSSSLTSLQTNYPSSHDTSPLSDLSDSLTDLSDDLSPEEPINYPDKSQMNQYMEPVVDIGQNLQLPYTYTLWCHDIYNKDWSIKSYQKLFVMKTVSDFWSVFNNFNKLGMKYMHFFLMKNNIFPTWESVDNRDGGVCSFKADIEKAILVFEDLNVRMMCSTLNHDNDDVNGISISPKNNWAMIKVWNRDSKKDLTRTLYPDLLTKYVDYSVKYKVNEPEY